ncbi:hypothetical protein DRB96_08250 [Streptomyces sp. ICC1]|nr:hypothetical protein DRB89_09035 [Streptomyces sp. ICC4]AWZ12312.1 hypothetical protein DRB96_08250 [Streptomyces sp. ICC1]
MRVRAVVTESGVACREEFYMADNNLHHTKIRIPAFTLPAGTRLLKAVAGCWPACIGWDEVADHAMWSVDVTVTGVDGSDVLFLEAAVGEMGEKTNMWRIGYHLTAYLGGEVTDNSLAQLII